MGTAERRRKIIRILCRRRHETITNLASEFGVSERTILRDIEALSVTEPIYTQCGRYGGGVYIVEDYRMERMYMSDKELLVLHKLTRLAQENEINKISNEDISILNSIIKQYSKPNN